MDIKVFFTIGKGVLKPLPDLFEEKTNHCTLMTYPTSRLYSSKDLDLGPCPKTTLMHFTTQGLVLDN